jgi:CubicO group peptidase (beta-lactamase class C family)
MMSSSPSTRQPIPCLPTGDPEDLGFSLERLARIGPSLRKYIDAKIAPGTLALVARHGSIVYFEAQGSMDVEANKPVQKDAIYRMMSMTKPITCAALMMLYEEGHFLLTDPISKWLPCFKDMTVKGPGDRVVPAGREINIRDCLTHTPGFSTLELTRARMKFERPVLGKEGAPSVNTPVAFGTVEQVLEELAKAPLNHQPGTFWEYNPGHEVVGVLVEKISGQTLEEFFQERIFGPLKMVDSHFYLPAEKVGRFVAGYRVDTSNDGRYVLCDVPATSAKVAGPKTYFSGAGGLLSTASDYARFAQAMLNGGELEGARILGRKTIELMTTNHTGDLDVYLMGPGYGFGLGVTVRTSLSENPAVGSLGTYGWSGAYCTWYFADPKEDLFGLLFTQVKDYRESVELTALKRHYERMVYQALVD